MKNLNAILFFVAVAASLKAAQIDSVVVEQQWPWSTDIKVKYVLSNVSSPVDVALRLYDGANEINAAKVKSVAKGELFGVSANGEHVIRVDPKALFGTGTVVVGDFRADLSLSASSANVNEVIYKIYDLDDGSCKDVTRADILGNNYGSYETDFSNLGEGFSSSVSNVLIWTGVTNDAKYATSKLVLRKIPAASYGPWMMGSGANEDGRVQAAEASGTDPELQHQVTHSNDFWMGVFEVTQAQWAKIVTGHTIAEVLPSAWPSYFTEATSRDTRPVECISHYHIRGKLSESAWPQDHVMMEQTCFLSLLRARLNGSPLIDLPTEAQWEFACRAGTTTQLFSGKNLLHSAWEGDDNLKVLGRSRRSGGYIDGVTVPDATTPASQGGTARVGSYLPNAYGLYDMLGNVNEWCLDYYEPYAADAVEEPAGPERHNDNWKRVVRGGNWSDKCRYCRCASRGDFGVGDSGRNPNPNYGTMTRYYGFRLCLTEE